MTRIGADFLNNKETKGREKTNREGEYAGTNFSAVKSRRTHKKAEKAPDRPEEKTGPNTFLPLTPALMGDTFKEINGGALCHRITGTDWKKVVANRWIIDSKRGWYCGFLFRYFY